MLKGLQLEKFSNGSRNLEVCNALRQLSTVVGSDSDVGGRMCGRGRAKYLRDGSTMRTLKSGLLRVH